MSTFAAPPRAAWLPGRVLARFAALSVALSAAFLFAPPPLAAIWPDGGYAGERGVADAAASAFGGYWASGDAALTPDLERLVDYWVRFHIFKAAFALVLTIVLASLSVRLWRAFLAAGDRSRGRRVALGAGGGFTAGLGVFAVMLVMANVQCALAPLSSLATFLDVGPAGSTGAVRSQLHATVGTGAAAAPPLQRLIDDFGYYHAVMAVLGAAVAAGFVAVSARLWHRFARAGRADPRARRVFAVSGVLAVLAAVAFGLLAFGNVGVAEDPAPALLAFFEGGW